MHEFIQGQWWSMFKTHLNPMVSILSHNHVNAGVYMQDIRATRYAVVCPFRLKILACSTKQVWFEVTSRISPEIRILTLGAVFKVILNPTLIHIQRNLPQSTSAMHVSTLHNCNHKVAYVT